MYRSNPRSHIFVLPGLLALLSLCVLADVGHAQNSDAPPAKPTGSSTTPQKAAIPRATSKTSTTRLGQIVALDAAAGTLTLKDRAGKTTEYALTDKTRYMKAKKPAQSSDFKAGDDVVLKIRKPKDEEPPKVVEMDDANTATWLRGLRSKTTAATLKEIGDDTLTASLGADTLTYTINDKTRWMKGGKEVALTEFKPGEKVYIVPTSRANGAIYARAVTDSPTGAAQAKEHLSRTLHGVLQNLSTTDKTLTLHTTAGETRMVPFTPETQVTQGSKVITVETLKTGQSVSVALKRNAAGVDVASRITVGKGRATTRKSASSAGTGGKRKP